MIVATPHSMAMAKYCEEYGLKFRSIDPSAIFASNVLNLISRTDLSLVVSYAPDLGSIPRAISLASILNCPVYFNLKNREINGRTNIVDESQKEIEKPLLTPKYEGSVN